jgi:hypothetical protein
MIEGRLEIGKESASTNDPTTLEQVENCCSSGRAGPNLNCNRPNHGRLRR